ncbi:unnamed protein product, partial [Mesocestoides corti]|uniref:Gag-pol polyprotein n=1 Tax=Mesocestoides corti TaxID=53468 RepID=A0A0R3UKN9_MESCO
MGPKRTSGGSGTVSKTDTDLFSLHAGLERLIFRPRPPEFNPNDDIEEWIETMDDYLRYEEPAWERVVDYMADVYDLVQKSYPGAPPESLTVAFVLKGLPAEIGKRHASPLSQSITDVERVLSADPDLGVNAPPPASDQTRPSQQWRPRTNRFQGPRIGGSGGQWTGKPRGGEGFKKPPVDTGAGCSLVNPRRFPPKTFQPYLVASSINVKAANGTVMRSKGCVDIALTTTGSVYQHTLYLCQDMPYDGILGSDFLD